MSDPIEFLEARLDEDEAWAEDAPSQERPRDPDDPARVLRDVAAKRRIIAMYEAPAYGGWDPADRAEASGRREGLREVIRALASVYGWHEDYREEWR